MKAYYSVIIEPYDEGFVATVPDVPGCTTGGKTIAETIDLVKDALCGCLCVYEDEGIDLPEPHLPCDFEVKDGSFTTLVDVDTLKYREETDTRAVRKNVSMPAWLLNMAESRGVNCSQVLQDALKREFGFIV